MSSSNWWFPAVSNAVALLQESGENPAISVTLLAGALLPCYVPVSLP